MKRIAFFLISFWLVGGVSAQSTEFQLPPKEILQLADVKAPVSTQISRDNHYMAQMERPLYKSLEELAENELRLAGLRINPENFSQSRTNLFTQLRLQKLPEGTNIPLIGFPSSSRFASFSFSPDEKMAAFLVYTARELQLWTLDIATGNSRRAGNFAVSTVLGSGFQWIGKGHSLLVRLANPNPLAKLKKELPKGPAVQEAGGSKAPARTYQDLLKNEQDEVVFDHYAGSEMAVYNPEEDKLNKLLPSALYKRISFSPDGQYILTEEVKKPYSYSLTYSSFPSRFTLYSAQGNPVKVLYDRPLQDKIPTHFDAVEAGMRNISWRDDKPASLYWSVAPDGGDPAQNTSFRDELFFSDYPFTQSVLICKLKNRFQGIEFGREDFAVVEDGWRKNRNTRMYAINPSKAGAEPRVLFDYSTEDVYADPGNFETEYNAWGRSVLAFSPDGKSLFLSGEGCSPEGNRPFLDAFSIETGKTRRLWRADGITHYERLVRIIDLAKGVAITQVEGPTDYPNLYWKNLFKGGKSKQITFYENPFKALGGVKKEKIHYFRKDGVALSANLYLPAGYDKKRDGRLPMLMEAYPTEFKDDKAASQIKDSPHRFISVSWGSPVFWVMRGFAVLENAQFPIIGKGDAEPNDTYIPQLVADAEAAIQAVDSMGVVDPKRCAVMGHSYGAFMTANLLAHSRLFAAGIARSGAYNRTLTPFGFQAEERSYWKAKEVYTEMSPFTYADQFKDPILLIHGDADNNPGTFTLQSERLFQAIKGNGGRARLVLLPYESHGYAAKENIYHMLWEMDSWLMKWVKNKP